LVDSASEMLQFVGRKPWQGALDWLRSGNHANVQLHGAQTVLQFNVFAQALNFASELVKFASDWGRAIYYFLSRL